MSTELIIVLVSIVAGGVVLGWMIVAGFHELRVEVRAMNANRRNSKGFWKGCARP